VNTVGQEKSVGVEGVTKNSYSFSGYKEFLTTYENKAARRGKMGNLQGRGTRRQARAHSKTGENIRKGFDIGAEALNFNGGRILGIEN